MEGWIEGRKRDGEREGRERMKKEREGGSEEWPGGREDI